jgi:aspartyl-tRNA(Asn)/glutamyl-tRNA(Gln) amidotransferase subunit C
MAQLDDVTVRHVAHLARIAISDAEVRLYGEQLSKILDYVNQLREVDTSHVPPSEHPLLAANVFRPDVPHQPWSPDVALKNAPDRHGDFFRVPKVLDQEDA